MSRTVYVAGRYVPHSRASVHVEDRGNVFSDAVYEVVRVVEGRLIDGDRHLARLHRSLAGLEIAPPMGDTALLQVIEEVVRRNRLANANVHIQISRGTAPRDHAFPRNAKPTLIVMARRMKRPSVEARGSGVRVITAPDLRWGRRDYKTVSLLPNVLACQAAATAGAQEAWLLKPNGEFTEASHSNTYIVDSDGTLITHPLGPDILGGVTRSVVLELAESNGISVKEQAFDQADVETASEALMTGTGSWVLPVVQVDQHIIGDGSPGLITRRLQQAYERHVFGNRETGSSA